LRATRACYFPGTLIARRWAEDHARRLLVGTGLVAAAPAPLFDAVRLAPGMSGGVLALLMATVGARTIAATAFDLHASPERRAALIGGRAAATQLGYLAGAGLGGLALATGGYGALGALAGGLFGLGVIPHLGVRHVRRARSAVAPAIAPAGA
jgi:predicted MFS family arabinose efflux permease